MFYVYNHNTYTNMFIKKIKNFCDITLNTLGKTNQSISFKLHRFS